MVDIQHATDANFEELVLKAERPVVVDFWAAWCGPCKMVAPEMEKLAAKYEGRVDVVKVDVDANPRLSQAFNIMSIPTIAFFKPGATPQGVVGFRPLDQLEVQFGLAEFEGAAAASDALAVEASQAETAATETVAAE
jgi:thioredoxin 1